MASKKKSEHKKIGDNGQRKATDLEMKITTIRQHEIGKAV
jgi:hypothetical protein